MYRIIFYVVLIEQCFGKVLLDQKSDESMGMINVVDLTKATTWKDLSSYYTAVEKHWKMCINCGVPGLGTAMHLDFANSAPGSMHPAIIPMEFLLTRLSIIDVSSLTRLHPSLVLTLDVALQWMALKTDPKEPTLLLFKFGWKEEQNMRRSCVCEIPGLSYELAEWIAANLSHVVGVATDAPTLESEQTREFTTRTITNLLGRSGIYMIDNVNMKRKVPDTGCMSIAMPLMLLNSNYVPTRLTAFCPSRKTDQRVMIALKKHAGGGKRVASRVYDVNLEEIMS
ncbi:uncharacterized protein LOC135074374 [Ostrinia nubilalis]|uniref:uncharacterized protein LOC114349707 n=1 Tax=Ostrinia furnacalis TaxID=93504 RepID=UPI00103F4CF2|nr:uncharacterized protein LOC114349707 [Ostrinia furnacalis]